MRRLRADRSERGRPDGTANEVRAAFNAFTIERCEPADVTLQEGPLLRGKAAVLRFVARAPELDDETQSTRDS